MSAPAARHGDGTAALAPAAGVDPHLTRPQAEILRAYGAGVPTPGIPARVLLDTDIRTTPAEVDAVIARLGKYNRPRAAKLADAYDRARGVPVPPRSRPAVPPRPPAAPSPAAPPPRPEPDRGRDLGVDPVIAARRQILVGGPPKDAGRTKPVKRAKPAPKPTPQPAAAEPLMAYDAWWCRSCSRRPFEPGACCGKPLTPVRVEIHRRDP